MCLNFFSNVSKWESEGKECVCHGLVEKKYNQYQTNNVSSKILCIQKKMLFELEAILEGLK